MSIIKRKRGNVIYVCEVKYAGIKNGKQKLKEKVIGRLDEAGNFVPSKKMRGKKPEDFPAQIEKVTTTTTKLRVVEKKDQRDAGHVKKAEPIEPEIVEPKIVATSKTAKEVISGTTKIENVLFDPRKNPVFYDANVPAVDINIGNKGKMR